MTQYKTRNADLPDLSTINDIVFAYFAMWERQARVLNEVWTDCSREQATSSDWQKAWNKLLKTWTESARDLCDSFMRHGGSHAGGGAPLVTFVIDRSAETDAGRQTVPLPAGVDPKTLVATPLVSLTQDSHPVLDSAVIRLLAVQGGLEIGVVVPAARPAPGHYLSVVCEPKAGAPAGVPLTNSQDPPPRPVVANVLVVFI